MARQIGIGQWFRYFTGGVEVVVGLLFLFPRTCLVGAAVLALTMVGAMSVHLVVRHRVAGVVFPAVVLAVEGRHTGPWSGSSQPHVV